MIPVPCAPVSRPYALPCTQRRKLNRQHSKSGLSSLASSLHSSFDSDSPTGGGASGGPKEGSLSNSRELLAPLKGVHGTAASGSQAGPGALAKPLPLGAAPQGLGGPLSKVPPLAPLSSASPSASGSDWPALGAPPQHLGTLKVREGRANVRGGRPPHARLEEVPVSLCAAAHARALLLQASACGAHRARV